MITEALIATGRASRVDRIRIAPPGPDGRRAVVQWTHPTGHGTAPTTQTVDGTIPA